MDLDEPCRRYSLQENGRYFIQPVCEDSEFIGVDPSSYEGFTPARAVHKPAGKKAQRKFSLDEYGQMHPVSVAGMPQLQSMYPIPTMSYPLQMAATMRPVQEVQPICLEKSQKISPQSLHMKTVKRRHLMKAQKSHSQGYYHQGFPGFRNQSADAMYINQTDSMYVNQAEMPTSQNRNKHAMYMNQSDGLYANQSEMSTNQNKNKQPMQLSPPMSIQSLPNVYAFPDVQTSGKVGPQSYGSVQSQINSGNMTGLPSMPGLSPVQMVHPIQQYQPVSPNSPIQLVPMQGMPGTNMQGVHGSSRFALRSGSLDDDVFMAYRPYKVAYPVSDEESDGEDSNYSHPQHYTSTQQYYEQDYDPYLSVRSAPASAADVASIIKSSQDTTKKQRTARRVSFEDEVLEEKRKRSWSSPPDTAHSDNNNKDEWDGYEDDDAYLKMRQRYAARKSNATLAPDQVVNSPAGEDEPSEESVNTPEDDGDSYEGIKRLPRVKSALKSSREKQNEDEDEDKENKPRRKSVPAQAQVDMGQETEPQQKGRRNSICPMTAYNLRGSSTVAIDNKIEQAMDLVKSHLMFAVREEVEVLREQIAELIERNNQLEYENGILRAAASPETLAKLAQPRQQQPPSSSSSS